MQSSLNHLSGEKHFLIFTNRLWDARGSHTSAPLRECSICGKARPHLEQVQTLSRRTLIRSLSRTHHVSNTIPSLGCLVTQAKFSLVWAINRVTSARVHSKRGLIITFANKEGLLLIFLSAADCH